MISRRAFVAGLGAATFPSSRAIAQRTAGLPVVGLLGAGTIASHGPWISACVERLRELGWVEDRTIRFEYRWAEARPERVAEIIAEFVAMPVDIVVASGPPVRALAKATSTIPIVFVGASDPVAGGLVASLARPGGNATGFTSQSVELGAKRLQIFREIVPELKQLAVIFNPANLGSREELAEITAVARSFGMDTFAVEIRRPDDVAPAIQSIRGRAEGLYVVLDPLVSAIQTELNAMALDARLPVFHGLRSYVASGGLLSYGVSFPDLFRRAGDYVDRILKGARPGDLPIEQPTKFELVINLRTAKALGRDISPTLLAQADEVIE